ncbi:MAG: ligase-associated DNA damage response exonuclease [Rhodothermales bacterium]|nr:ligase-associated DNA damage response exonuclease [Rhodothermales bacterium]
MPPPLLERTDRGLYCAAGGFYVDPWEPVDRAVITHAHADHMRRGCRHYLAAEPARLVMRARLYDDAEIETVPYGEGVAVDGVRVSFHPAGHVLGSAQVRLEHKGEVWVASGDYKVRPDPTCAPFELVRCHTFITESTFGLPIYRWQPEEEVAAEVNAWWRQNREEGKASLVFAYSLGKAQRVLALLDPAVGPIYTHGAVERLTRAYRETGIDLPPTTYVTAARDAGKKDWAGSLIVAPPSSNGTAWMRKFGAVSTAFASGWMRIRGPRRRRAVDRGFVLSDHVDWPGLTETVRATGAERVLVTHGYVAVVVRWLREQGLEADPLASPYTGERDDAAEPDDETD